LAAWESKATGKLRDPRRDFNQAHVDDVKGAFVTIREADDFLFQ
jgi:hypothetical protein